MKLLPPQRLRPSYYEGVEDSLRGAFERFLFEPLRALLREYGDVDAFENAAAGREFDLIRSIRQGRVHYEDGVFSGVFDAGTSQYLLKLGAEYNGARATYNLADWVVPAKVRAEAVLAARRFEELHRKMEKELTAMQARLERGMMPIPLDPAGPIEAIEEGFETAAKSLGIEKRIPKAQRAMIEKRYAEDVRPYVAQATSEYIDKMHGLITENVLNGFRFEQAVDDVEHLAGISESKARFLARQETALFMANYRRERFTAAGVTRYKWSTSHDIRVRPYADEKKREKYGDHRILDGQIFTYELKAPAKYMSFKQPCNPGEDAGCRCVDIAILE